ncbi:hypothetical protein ADUPG1_011457 [Aduncisulcus paluster]|uniref:Exportin-2 C-terminal domain-containing protein n=1 Tax=Aduncisulcus paluster TaxID=2918883 RepID=A0ABQ5JW06_9EUKA|nr:hypothetical protein ADUPG1_011457 [Aduncisulcus paluster]
MGKTFRLTKEVGECVRAGKSLSELPDEFLPSRSSNYVIPSLGIKTLIMKHQLLRVFSAFVSVDRQNEYIMQCAYNMVARMPEYQPSESSESVDLSKMYVVVTENLLKVIRKIESTISHSFSLHTFDTIAGCVRRMHGSHIEMINKTILDFSQHCLSKNLEDFTPFVIQIMGVLVREQLKRETQRIASSGVGGSVVIPKSFDMFFGNIMNKSLWKGPMIPALTTVVESFISSAPAYILTHSSSDTPTILRLCKLAANLARIPMREGEGFSILTHICLYILFPNPNSTLSRVHSISCSSSSLSSLPDSLLSSSAGLPSERQEIIREGLCSFITTAITRLVKEHKEAEEKGTNSPAARRRLSLSTHLCMFICMLFARVKNVAWVIQWCGGLDQFVDLMFIVLANVVEKGVDIASRATVLVGVSRLLCHQHVLKEIGHHSKGEAVVLLFACLLTCGFEAGGIVLPGRHPGAQSKGKGDKKEKEIEEFLMECRSKGRKLQDHEGMGYRASFSMLSEVSKGRISDTVFDVFKHSCKDEIGADKGGYVTADLKTTILRLLKPQMQFVQRLASHGGLPEKAKGFLGQLWRLLND